MERPIVVPSPSISRREFLAGAAAVGATILLQRSVLAAPEGRRTFSILHTNDMHSAFVGMGPAADYSPFAPNDDATRGGYARLATLIATRRAALEAEGPVLVLDAGDFSMGTPFAAACREVGGELQVMARMGYDATTFGNHEFDLGADGLAKAIGVAAAAGAVPAVLASNCDVSSGDASLVGLQALGKSGTVRRHVVIERGGLRFGVFGVLGKEALIYTNAGAAKFADPIETAKEVVKHLRETEKVDVVIALSHGGVVKDKDGRFTTGEDVHLAEAVPGIDVVVGGHSHTELPEPILANGRAPVVQTGKEGRNLGELTVAIDGTALKVASYRLHPVDDTVPGDRAVADAIEKLKAPVTAAVFASRGYGIDQPLAIAPRDLPNTFTDIAAGTLLANLVTDAFRGATKADIGFTVNGMMRASILRGKTGVVTVYDVFAVAPLGSGVVDPTAGSALVTGWFTGRELKNLLEFFLVDSPAHPGEYFPRASGLRFRYDPSRPKLDVVTGIDLGDLGHGYRAIDFSGKDERLYSLTTSLYVGLVLAAIPKYTKGKLALVAKNRDGKPLTSRVEALEDPRRSTPYLLPPPGTTDRAAVATGSDKAGVREIKEWQAIMDHLRGLPVREGEKLPTIPVDERAAEVRAIRAG